MNECKVSVCVVTYNQQDFIYQCLDSLLNQKTNFVFEILVADDFSTDGTRKILEKFKRDNPEKVKLFLHEQNIGAYNNFAFVHKMAKGKYVVHMDGDDYTLPGKLQVQADYLDKNENCNIVWHRAFTYKNERYYQDNNSEINYTQRTYDIVDLICNVTIGKNSTSMYRNDYKNSSWYNYYELDFPANVLKLTDKGKTADFIKDGVYSVYRSGIGISQTQNHIIKIKIYKWLLQFYKDNLTEKSIINAKMFWQVVSDLRHLKKSFYYGLYAFFSTITHCRIKSITEVRKRQIFIDNEFNEVKI
jgi:glycosyltransferase involved in cell wall biosynthesis